jgi:hypothetical protein
VAEELEAPLPLLAVQWPPKRLGSTCIGLPRARKCDEALARGLRVYAVAVVADFDLGDAAERVPSEQHPNVACRRQWRSK